MQYDHRRIAFGFLIVFFISLIQLVYVYDRINRSVDSKIQGLTHQNQILIQQTNHIMISKFLNLTDSLKKSEQSNIITNSKVVDLTEGLKKSESEVTRLKEIVDNSDILNSKHLIKRDELEIEVQQLKNFVNEMCEQEPSIIETYMKLPTVQDALAKGSRATRFVHHTEFVNSLKKASQASFGGNWDRHPKAAGKTAVILLTNFMWIEFLENLIISLERADSPLVNSFLVVALDTETVEWVKNFRVKLNAMDFSAYFSNAGEDNHFMTPGFVELCYIKTEMTIGALIHGVNVFIFDLDISFKKDPLLFMDIESDFTGFCLQKGSREMNYGMLWVRSSDKTVSIFMDMYKRIENEKLKGNEVTNDQRALRDVYNEPGRDVVRNCVDESFNGEKCAEKIYFSTSRKDTAAYFHGTCLTGMEKKKSYLQRVEAWFLD